MTYAQNLKASEHTAPDLNAEQSGLITTSAVPLNNVGTASPYTSSYAAPDAFPAAPSSPAAAVYSVQSGEPNQSDFGRSEYERDVRAAVTPAKAYIYPAR